MDTINNIVDNDFDKQYYTKEGEVKWMPIPDHLKVLDMNEDFLKQDESLYDLDN